VSLHPPQNFAEDSHGHNYIRARYKMSEVKSRNWLCSFFRAIRPTETRGGCVTKK
jgi:hypothetical protein